MSISSADFAGLLDSAVHIAFDRAAAELRGGRPILIESGHGATIIAALDGVSPHVYDTFRALPGASLVLTAKRGQALGFKVEDPAGFPLSLLDRKAAQRLATTPHIQAPGEWKRADAVAGAALDVCKYALLLPAVLSAPTPAGAQLPADLHRVALDQLTVPAPEVKSV